MLHEGRMELEGAKKTVEGVISDVKAIKGIFNWFIGLVSQSRSTQEEKKNTNGRHLKLNKRRPSFRL